MKRVGNLMQLVVTADNLFEAYLRAKRGKGDKKEVLRFQEHLEEKLNGIAWELACDSYTVGDYYRFIIFDPKKRMICAAPFRDRVAMHAMMRVCHLVFDNYQIFDSYASRKQKGTYAAIERTKTFVKKYQWFAKLDVCHFFDSISHEVLSGQLESLFKDKILLNSFGRIIDGYHTEAGRGLPIGNLTSQYFANHYLAQGDHLLKEKLHALAMVRYMDDIILFDNDKERLKAIVRNYITYAYETLSLKMHELIINRCHYGVPFLGYVVFPNKTNLNLSSRRRFVRHLMDLSWMYECGFLSENIYRERLNSVFSFVNHADSKAYQRKVMNNLGIFP